MAQCFAIMPIRGVKSKNADDLRFAYRSIRTFYTFVVFMLTSFNAVLTIIYFTSGPIVFARVGTCPSR